MDKINKAKKLYTQLVCEYNEIDSYATKNHGKISEKDMENIVEKCKNLHKRIENGYNLLKKMGIKMSDKEIREGFDVRIRKKT